MELLDFLYGVLKTTKQRQQFCKRLKKHPNYIYSLAAGVKAKGKPRRASAELARKIEEETEGLVHRYEMLPDVFDKPKALHVYEGTVAFKRKPRKVNGSADKPNSKKTTAKKQTTRQKATRQ